MERREERTRDKLRGKEGRRKKQECRKSDKYEKYKFICKKEER